MSRFVKMEISTRNINIIRFEKGTMRPVQDLVSVEEPLEIQVITNSNSISEKISISVTMRTPGNDDELAVGFLYTEGIINGREQIIKIESDIENVIGIHLDSAVKINKEKLTRNFYTTSSCGVCGKASIEAIKISCRVIENELRLSKNILVGLAGTLFDSQKNFQNTGGLHASALFDFNGNLIRVREDVGRHNALDKIIGSCLLNGKAELMNSILLVSGRASFELVQKAAVVGIPILISIGAPSSLAIDLAQEKGITLVGFLKQDRFNIYTHAKRIELNE